MRQILVQLCFVFSTVALVGTTPCNTKEVVLPQDSKEPDEEKQTEQKELSIELQIPKTIFVIEEPIQLTLTVTNHTANTLELESNTSQMYDFVVSKNSAETWRWSNDRFFLQVIRTLELQPGEQKSFQETWAQIDNNQKSVTPGHYVIQGSLMTSPGGNSQPVPIEIKKGE